MSSVATFCLSTLALGLALLGFLPSPGDLSPQLFQGRIRPSLGKMTETTLIFPLKQNLSIWYSIKEAKELPFNRSAYSDQRVEQILKSWDAKDSETSFLLHQAYAELMAQKTLSPQLPNDFKLWVEAFFLKAPWLELTCLILVLGALLTFVSPHIGLGLCLSGFLLQSIILASKWWVLERPPVTNMQETALFVPWVVMLVALFFTRKGGSKLLPIAAFLSASLFGLLIYLQGHISFDPVQPVLNSNLWLTIHVLMVVGSYGLFFLASGAAHALFIYHWQKKRAPFLQEAILPLLYSGVILLVGGTILGGVWAAQSWGRFWDWDPKESWAFISALWYLGWIHAYRFGKISKITLAWGALLGFLVISFTWYGVNYILGAGLHSYGFGTGGLPLYLLFIGAELCFAGAALKTILTKEQALP